MPGPAFPDGYELRRCTAADVEAVADLHARRTDPVDADDFRLIATDTEAGPGWSAAVFDRATGRAVSTVMLLDETVRIGPVELPVGQIELVATDEDHEGRGFVRKLMGWAHDESVRRGHTLQLIVGIPNFYRQFGYRYAIPIGSWRPIRDAPGPVDTAVTVRPATAADIDALASLADADQERADVSMAHSPACWRWVVARTGDIALVAERGGRVVAGARILPPTEESALCELYAVDERAAISLVGSIAADRPALVILDRPWTTGCRAVAPFLDVLDDAERVMSWYYVRVPDVADVLNRIRPVLQQRLDATDSPLPDRLLVSSYRSHLDVDLHDGKLGTFRPGGPLQWPISQGGSGIPADAWPALLFGPHGAVGLERLVPDVLLGQQRPTMDVLFPPVTADLATLYLPW